jgi:superfamily II DNA or RNA helicase
LDEAERMLGSQSQSETVDQPQSIAPEITAAIARLRTRLPRPANPRMVRDEVVGAPRVTSGARNIRWQFNVLGESDTDYAVEVELTTAKSSGPRRASAPQRRAESATSYVAEAFCECALFEAARACIHCAVAVDWLSNELQRLDSSQIGKLSTFISARGGKWYADQLVSSVEKEAAGGNDDPTRLQWRVRIDPEQSKQPFVLRVYGQKAIRGGRQWSKGRQLDWNHFTFRENCIGSPRDMELANFLRMAAPRYGTEDARESDALPLLAGHPNVVWEHQPDVPVAVSQHKLRLAIESLADGSFEVVPTLAGIQLRAGNESDDCLAAVCGTGLDPRRVVVADLTTDRLLFSQPLARPVADWLDEVFGAEVPPLKLTHSEAVEFVAAASEVGRLVPLEIPEMLAGPLEDLEPVVSMLLAPRDGGLTVALRISDPRLNEPLVPGESPDEVRVVTDQGPRRLVRALPAEREAGRKLATTLRMNRFVETDSMMWFVESLESVLELLEEIRNMGDQGPPVLWPEGRAIRVMGEITPSALRVRVDDRRDWFGIHGSVQLEDQEVSIEELLKAIRGGDAYVRIGENAFARISESFRKRLMQLGDAVHHDRGGVKVARVAVPVVQELLGEDCMVEAVARWHETLDRLESVRKLTPRVPSGLKADLRDYQKEGYRWLARLSAWGAGGVLADDMGLGKTVQALGVLIDRAPKGAALVVAPTSVGENWMRETERFAPDLRPHLYRDHDREALLERVGPGDLVIASYALLQRDADRFQSRCWHSLVLDEAQFIKNAATKTARAARDIEADWRLALTGTPLENHLGELWSLLRTILPGLLGSWEHFRTRFADPIERQADSERRESLARLVRPFILRRTKSNVLSELPPRTEITLYADLDDDERKRYEAARMLAIRELADRGEAGQTVAASDNGGGQKRFKVLAWLTRLRQLSCHPRLVDASYRGDSAKLQLLMETVDDLREGEHRALIFSQFVQHLALVREALDRRKISYQYLDGATPAAERQKRVDAFQRGEGDLFLISLKAGGTGLNLTAADYVLHLDPWWNPAVEDQATDRVHRIGQKRAVTVLRLVARDTIEEQILALHADKRELVASVLDGTDRAGRLNTDELVDLIRVGG